MGKRNPVALALRTPAFRTRKPRCTKGKGSYTRKKRHRSGRTDGVSSYLGLPLRHSIEFRILFHSPLPACILFRPTDADQRRNP